MWTDQSFGIMVIYHRWHNQYEMHGFILERSLGTNKCTFQSMMMCILTCMRGGVQQAINPNTANAITIVKALSRPEKEIGLFLRWNMYLLVEIIITAY